MKTYKIELIKIGRNNHSESIEINFISFKIACQWAIDQAGKHLLSSDISMASTEEQPNDFTVFAGIRPVGNITVNEVMKK